ncbi:pirin family protein [Paraburkholderia pallida]|uniref:Pirin family protein n=1 Tax=Paraburkholderia pallida TaxID=2547399 RepID=A0A4P7D3U4_9BURK|nr:pirin family protein [Paraburkholderia pallida]QBR02648.1 pirin family protein [Paraburkholderia pallida]
MLTHSIRITKPVKGSPHNIGRHFSASSFRHTQFGGAMDPLLMVDHFRMTEPTFGPHPHAGFSAVTYLFEDSRSPHLNADSIGNELPIMPGSLHWMVAGRGVTHDEWPGGDDPEVHGLQFFVDLPPAMKSVAPYAVHLESADIPTFTADGARVRVIAGELGEVRSPVVLPQPFSLFDGFLDSGADLDLQIERGWGAWIYAINGTLNVSVEHASEVLTEGAAIALAGFSGAEQLSITARTGSHFVMLCGESVRTQP